MTAGEAGVQAEAGSSVEHLVALVCGLGLASSLLAYGESKHRCWLHACQEPASGGHAVPTAYTADCAALPV